MEVGWVRAGRGRDPRCAGIDKLDRKAQLTLQHSSAAVAKSVLEDGERGGERCRRAIETDTKLGRVGEVYSQKVHPKAISVLISAFSVLL